MATLFNTKISATYVGLLKTIDNAVLNATLRELTDGSGNQSGLFLNTAGDFKVTSVLEWGSLKDTGTGVTITQFVTAANGIENFNNDTTLPTSAAVKLYVDTKFSQTDTLTEVLGFGNTTSGKDIAVSAGDNITFTDTSRILMGVSSDLQIYHDSSNSYVRDVGTGRLWLDSNGEGVSIISDGSGSTPMAHFYKDAAVELYYNNSKKLETTNTGVDVTGNLVVSGTITGSGGSFLPLAGGTMTGNTLHGDNVKSIYGTGNDLEIFHDGTNSYVSDVGTGSLILTGTDLQLKSAGDEFFLYGATNGQVSLYHNGIKKFETGSTGVAVTGTLSTTSNVTVGANATFVDNGKAIFGAGGDLEIFHDGTKSRIRDAGSGDLQINATDFVVNNSADTKNLITAIDGGAVNLFFNASKKIETVTDGAKVTGNLEVTGTITGSGGSFLPLAGGTMTGNTIHNDNVKSIYGTSGDGLEIFHDGTDSFISDTGTGNLLLRAASNFEIEDSDGINMARFLKDNKVELYYDGSIKLETTNTGIQVNGNAALSTGFSIPDSQFGKFGTGDDIIIGHDSTNSIIRSATGDFFIDQSAVTKSMIFRVSNANALDTTALTINREGDLTTGADVTIAGNLTVNGTTTTINTQTLAVEDPLIELSKDNAANSVDIGFYGKYNDGTARYLGLFSDASDSNKFRLFKGTTVEPTTTVNIAGSGYVAASLEVAALEATTIATSGTVSVGNTLFVTEYIQHLGDTNNNIRFQAGRMTLQSKASASAKIDLHDNGQLALFSGGGTALTLDTSQNAAFAGAVKIPDAKVLSLGSSLDLQIFHESDNSFISNNIGDLTIRNLANDKDIIFQSDNGSGGTATYFFLDGSNSFTNFQLNARWVDNAKAEFGNSGDLQIYHDGSHSFIKDSGTGDLVILSNQVSINNAANTENIAKFIENGAVELYHNNVKKFETTANGISVQGSGQFTGGISGAVLTVPTIQLNGDFNVLNKAQTSYITLADRDTSGSEVVYNLANVGSATFAGDLNITQTTDVGVLNTTNLESGAAVGLSLTYPTSNVAAGDGLAIAIGIAGRGRSYIANRNDTANLDASNLVFYTEGGGTIVERMVINTEGNVGIGEDSPDFLVDAKKGYSSGDGKVAKFRAGNDATFVQFDTVQVVQSDVPCLAIIESSTGTQADEQKLTFSTGDTRAIIGTSTTVTDGMSFYVNRAVTAHGYAVTGTRALHLQNNGNATFAGKIIQTVSSSGNAATFTNSDATSGYGVAIQSEGTSNTRYALILRNLSGSNTYGGVSTMTNQVGFWGIGASPTGTLGSRLTVGGNASIGSSYTGTSAPSNGLIVEGNVGIGTDSPTARITLADHTTAAGGIKFRSAATSVSLFSQGSGTLTTNGSFNVASRVRIAGGNAPADPDLGLSQTGGIGFTRVNTNDIAFITSATERMRITSVGDVLISKTAASFTTQGIELRDNGQINVAGNVDQFNFYNTSAGVYRFFVTAAGNIFATSTSITAISDITLKENIKPLETGLNEVMKLQPRRFNWKNGDGENIAGFIAQEVEQVLPDLVSDYKYTDEETKKSLKMGDMIPTLVNAIQELTAKVEMLEKNCKCKN